MIKISKPLTQATSMLGATRVIPQTANTKKGAAIDFLPRDFLSIIKLCSMPHTVSSRVGVLQSVGKMKYWCTPQGGIVGLHG